jgi:hypothetical protein
VSAATPEHPVLGTAARSAAELAADLRRDFERALFERYGQLPGQDPVLAALFHATAVQMARVYDEAEQLFPEAVFDDLVSGLGMPPRAARPAQTVVGFTGAAASELVTPDTPLVGINARGEHLPFAVDVPVRVGPSRLVLAAVAEAGRLHLLPGAVLPSDPAGEVPGAPLPLPSAVAPLAPGDVELAPTLFLAFEVDDTHLSGLGLFIDAQGPDHPVARALARSAWQLLDDAGPGGAGGVAREALVLRSREGPGGVRLLDWHRGAAPPPDDVVAGAAASPAVPGMYGPLCWRWPEVPPARRARARPPRALAAVLPQVLPVGFASRYDRPLAWVQVAIPAGTPGVAAAVQRVVAHCAPASNVEAFAERVDVGELGAAVAFRPEGARSRHLVAVLGITGEQGGRYVDEADPAAGLGRGRYRARGGDLELRPGRGPTGRFDRYVMARLLYTDGARGNGLQPGDVAGRGARTGRVGFGAASLTVSRGGGAPPAYAPAKVRFAELLRTRERVVTPADVDVAARAFEPRILGADVSAAVELGDDGVPRRVEVVTVRVRADDFADPGAELPGLAAALERHLGERASLGTTLRVDVRAERPATAARAARWAR